MAQIDQQDRVSRVEEAKTFVHAKSAWPRHDIDELEAVMGVLESGRVNALVHGRENRAFESEFANYLDVPHAIAVSNGTVAIELALRALGIGCGDEVIVPARSFFATASAVIATGAQPVFADVELETQNIDPCSVERLISSATRAIICVHLAGLPCDMDRLCSIATTHSLLLIEDCAQAHGAAWRGRKVGSFGDAAAFSFCTDKIMSTGGEGGMVVMKDETVWRSAWAYKDHGKDPLRLREPSPAAPGEFRYLHDTCGSNFRMTEMQAAIGRRQLSKLDAWLSQRRMNAETFLEQACQSEVVMPMGLPDAATHAYYKGYVRLNLDLLPNDISRSDLVSALMFEGIMCGSGSCPDMSQETAFANQDIKRDGDLPNAARLARETMMFQVDHTLSSEQTASFGRRLAEIADMYRNRDTARSEGSRDSGWTKAK